MRLPLSCMRCFQERGEPDQVFYPAELQDTGLYKLVCRAGHTSVVRVQQLKVEMLFELGLNAVVDGYYREAVSSFASTLERFYEFFIQVVCQQRGVDAALYAGAWKLVARQSERQLGAYAFLHLTEFRSLAPCLTEQMVGFRNDVVHRGMIPSREKAVAFGQAVLDVIVPTLSAMRRESGASVDAVVHAQMSRLPLDAGNSTACSTMSYPTALGLSHGRSGATQSVAAHVEQLQSRRARNGW